MKTFIGLFLLLLCLSACDDEEDGGIYCCSFEENKTDGCDGMGWEGWNFESVEFNSDDYYITPDEVCDNQTEAGLFCQSSCCIDYQYQNIELSKGSCN